MGTSLLIALGLLFHQAHPQNSVNSVTSSMNGHTEIVTATLCPPQGCQITYGNGDSSMIQLGWDSLKSGQCANLELKLSDKTTGHVLILMHQITICRPRRSPK